MSDSAPSPDSPLPNETASESPPQGSPSPDSKSSPPPAAPSNAASKAPPPPSSNGSDSSPPGPPPPSPGNNSSSPPPPPPPTTTTTPPPPKSNSPPPPLSSNPSSSLAPPPSSSSNDPGSLPPPPPLNSQSSAPPPPKESPPLSPSFTAPPPPNASPATPSPPSPPQGLSPPVVPETPTGASPLTPSVPKAAPPSQITPMKPTRSISSDTKPSNSAPSRHTNSSSSTPSSSKGSSESGSTSGNGVVVGLAVAGVVVVLVAAFIVFSRKKKRRRLDGFATHYIPPSSFSVRTDGYYYKHANPMGSSPSDSHHASKPPISPASGNMQESNRGHGYPSGQVDPAGSKSWFSYEELTDITNGFSHENLLGEGGFGCVYKGWLTDGRVVAVKQLKAGSGQGEREFRAEVEIISRVHHRHLVSLVGYCIAEYHRLLVYEFVPNNTLEHHLHGKELPVLDWPKRMKIAIGSARGLAYLHEDCHPRIIHRDIKSANILLDDSFEAQVADFGLAKLSNDTHTHVSTRVMGTFGYMAPEYASSGKLTDRSDVFSFGVVLLELITGRKPVDPSQPLGDESLVEWARPRLVHALETGSYEELVDARLENNFAKNEMFRMVEAAAACVRHSAPKRPRMVQVARALDTEGDMADLSNGVKFGQSTVFDSGQYSADIQKFRRMALGSAGNSSDYGYSEEYERRSSVHSGEFRSREAPHRPPPPHQWRPGEHSSGEFQSGYESETRPVNQWPPRPPNQWRPVDQYSSDENHSDHESETRAMNRRASDQNSGGSHRYNGRGFP